MKILLANSIQFNPNGGGTSGLNIQGTPIQLPSQIAQVNSQVGYLGTNVIQLAINLLIVTASLLVLIFVIWGGVKWMLSQGDKKKLEEARSTIIWALVGMFVIVLSFLIINVIGYFFGVNLLKIG